MNSRIKFVFLTIIAATVIIFCSGMTFAASAEEITEQPISDSELMPDDTEAPDEPPTDQETTEEVIGADFVEWLKATFGEEWESYYNRIIDNWGSIEEYLLQFGENYVPDSLQAGWDKFVSWLREYVVIWGSILAIVAIIVVYFVKKRATKKIVQGVVDQKMLVLSDELNKQGRATIAIMQAQKALLGKNQRFAETVAKIDESEKELKERSGKNEKL